MVKPAEKHAHRNVGHAITLLAFSLLCLGSLWVFSFSFEVWNPSVATSINPVATVVVLHGAGYYGAAQSAAVSCTSETITITLLNGFVQIAQLVLTKPRQSLTTVEPVIIDDLTALKLHLLNETGVRVRTFLGHSGSAELDRGSGRLSAILYDKEGEQLLASARWQCRHDS